ncbi:MAG: polysaccharide biosynthesis protein [Flavobacteriales bacterium]|nr:polysaccharide biosynthesis protein [Flavobacteriales bacterium]
MFQLLRTIQSKPQLVPRWVIFTIDLSLGLVALGLAFAIRFEFAPPAHELEAARRFIPAYILIRAFAMLVFRTYAGIIRFSGSRDARRVLLALSMGSVLFLGQNLAAASMDMTYPVPLSVVAIELLASAVFLIGFRVTVRSIYERFQSARPTPVVIFGAGEAGIITKQAVERPSPDPLKVVAFLDDDSGKQGKRIDGVPILPADRATQVLGDYNAKRLIVSIQRLDPVRKAQVIDAALDAGLRVMDVPPAQRWIQGELSAGQLRDTRIEDLLGRPVIELDASAIKRQVGGARILVTGGAGSIGSELVMQAIERGAAEVLAIDMAETPLHDLGLMGRTRLGSLASRLQTRIADVRDARSMQTLLADFKPDVIYHAAAYKHVPVMEVQPQAAWHTNVIGTANVINAAQQAGTGTFVLVSTDKAVNPSSVMGASKRMAELVVRSIGEGANMKCVITRFGNVLDSNGSVIPLFRKQIEAGGPVTLTHPEVTRYFMTIPEAVQLVMEAAATSEGDDIFVFDMGERVKIADLARRMIRLAGLVEDQDIDIDIVGLRTGEKLHEELMSGQENLLPTHHPKILRAGRADVDRDAIRNALAASQEAQEIGTWTDADARATFARHLPEYHPSEQEIDAT